MTELSGNDALEQPCDAEGAREADAVDGAVGVVRVGHVRPDGEIEYDPAYLKALDREGDARGQDGEQS